MTTSLTRPQGVAAPGVGGGAAGAGVPGSVAGGAGAAGERNGRGRTGGEAAGAEGRGRGKAAGLGPHGGDGGGQGEGTGASPHQRGGTGHGDEGGVGHHKVRGAGGRGSASAADAALRIAAEQVQALTAVDDGAWGGRDPRELASALRVLETMTRRVQAVASVVSAELVAAEEVRGRSRASAVKHVARGLKVPDGVLRDRADAGARAESPGMQALRSGRITAVQEKCVAKWVGELGDGAPEAVRDGLAARLVARAEQGEPTVVIGRYAGAELDALVPGRQDDRMAAQQRNRQAYLAAVQPDGTSLLGVTCTLELRAVLDTVDAKYAQRGRCLPAVVDPETGVPADMAGADLDELATADQRTYPQRVHDALRHVLEAGLESRHVGGRVGVASIVIRMTPEQAEAVFEGGHGGPVMSDAGSDLSARQAVGMSDRRSWFLSALHHGRELLTRIPIDGILDRGPGPDGDAGPEPGPDPGGGPRPKGGPPPAAAPDATGGSTQRPGRETGKEAASSPRDLAAWRREVTSPARGSSTGRRDPRGPRIASAAQRLVLYAAHGGCTHPVCHTPAARCQAHHIHEYRAGGHTVLVNLCLACPIHHGWIGRAAHSWRTEPDPAHPGRPRWIAPADDPSAEAA